MGQLQRVIFVLAAAQNEREIRVLITNNSWVKSFNKEMGYVAKADYQIFH